MLPTHSRLIILYFHFDRMFARGNPHRSQYQAASAAIKVYAAQQKLEAWQKEQDRKQAVAAASAAKEGAAGEASKDGAAGSAAEPKVSGRSLNPTRTPNALVGCVLTIHAASAAVSPCQCLSARNLISEFTACHRILQAEAGGATRAAAPDAAAAKAEGGAGPSAGKGPSIEELMERQRLEEATLPLMLEAMWAANVLDIQNTLKKVRGRHVVERRVGVGGSCVPEKSVGLCGWSDAVQGYRGCCSAG